MSDGIASDVAPKPDAQRFCASIDGAALCEDFDESDALPPSLTAFASPTDAAKPYVSGAEAVSAPNVLVTNSPGNNTLSYALSSVGVATPTQSFALDFDMKCTHSGASAYAGANVFLNAKQNMSLSIFVENGTILVVFTDTTSDSGTVQVAGTKGAFACDAAFHHLTLQAVKGNPSTVSLLVDSLVASQLTATTLSFGPLSVHLGVGGLTTPISARLDNVVLRAK